MPPFARTLDEEGLVLRQVCIAEAGRFLAPDLPGCRESETVRADLEAQVAACAVGERAFQALCDAVGAPVVAAQMEHLLRWAERAVIEVLRGFPPGEYAAEERLDHGLRLGVSIRVQGERAAVRLEGAADAGNLNAPPAVARAALLYAFRCLVGEEIPFNEGALRPFDLSVEPGGLFDPRPPRAVAGGNVETSQRLVDAVLRALGALAASQGTMNNLTVGTPRGAWYETIAGGMGAGPGFSGASGVQVHMTNTPATDVEVLEHRFPVRLERFALRRGSGGPGRWRGGDGVVKEWCFLDDCDVALLAGRRVEGAPGLAGGGSGAPGLDERDRGSGWEPAPATWRARAGDRLRIQTPGGGGWGVSEPSDT
jgi:5-oxoprolinase (ATP-hydrolysing)